MLRTERLVARVIAERHLPALDLVEPPQRRLECDLVAIEVHVAEVVIPLHEKRVELHEPAYQHVTSRGIETVTVGGARRYPSTAGPHGKGLAIRDDLPPGTLRPYATSGRAVSRTPLDRETLLTTRGPASRLALRVAPA